MGGTGRGGWLWEAKSQSLGLGTKASAGRLPSPGRQRARREDESPDIVRQLCPGLSGEGRRAGLNSAELSRSGRAVITIQLAWLTGPGWARGPQAGVWPPERQPSGLGLEASPAV